MEPSRAKPRASRPGDSSSKSQPTLRSSWPTYALIKSEDAVVGLMSPVVTTCTPYSVSIPQTFVIATPGRYPRKGRQLAHLRQPAGPAGRPRTSEVLTGPDPFDRTSAALLPALAHQRADVDD